MANLATVIWRLRALVRPKVTFGVRCIVMDNRERVLLVRHTYMPGWQFPGGGVDPHESAREAALREVTEGTGLAVKAPAQFVGLYFNKAMAGRDHIAFFAVRDHPAIEPDDLRPRALEIAEVRAVPLSELPDDLSVATRRRLDELFGRSEPAEVW